ncbi:hypothetical protein CE91St25_15380 [Campylobacter ureolyticus]|uniref:hypothetical protein n=1 Tax=Campylobacter ureolyticus TaxID=827 RepID=UPI001FC8D59C|nr:hypothetical protein [Campylobacter ureolyticus]GKH61202.1 hypothetical protein CE91St25_15380 [Campylobacter ureolyticus]
MRKLEIMANDVEWQISVKGYDIWDSKYAKKENEKYKFATFCIENNQIMGMFDMDVKDEVLKIAKKDPLMQEICEFKHKDYKFKGSFIDALKYIKQNFK